MLALAYSGVLGLGLVYEDQNGALWTRPWLGWWAEAPQRLPGELTEWTARVLPLTWQHVVNLAVHLVNVILVRVLVRRLGASALVALLAAGLFAVHPLGSEAVAYLSARGVLLATMGVLIALLMLPGDWCWSAGALAFAGWAHPGTAAAGMGLCWLVGRWTRVRTWPVLLYGLAGALVFGHWPAGGDVLLGSAGDFLLREVGEFGRLVRLVLWPVGFSVELPVMAPVLAAGVGVLLVVGTFLLWLLAEVEGPFETVWRGWVWGLLVFLPRFLVPRFEGLHERHAYLALIGWMWALAAVIAPWETQERRYR